MEDDSQIFSPLTDHVHMTPQHLKQHGGAVAASLAAVRRGEAAASSRLWEAISALATKVVVLEETCISKPELFSMQSDLLGQMKELSEQTNASLAAQGLSMQAAACQLIQEQLHTKGASTRHEKKMGRKTQPTAVSLDFVEKSEDESDGVLARLKELSVDVVTSDEPVSIEEHERSEALLDRLRDSWQ